MSILALCGQESNPSRVNDFVPVIVVVLVLWPAAAEIVGVYVNTMALLAALLGGSTAVAYSNHRNRA
ncbi:hypothetical protein [Streptomyces sp. NPDC051183]|uniref:hypothetical protein n=1 Tax=Streptomyces sp. NPDC051183 TaxID=3155165 RepID=UPI0034413805